MSAIHITQEDFEREVLQSDRPVLVDFWAAWCGPCQSLSPVVDEIAAEQPKVKVCKVNVEKERGLASRFQVMSIPTLLLFDRGQVINRAVGARPKEEILSLLPQ